MSIELPIKRLLYEINTPMELPFNHHFPTITLRGAFGYSLLQIVARDEALNRQEQVALCKHLFFPNDISDKSIHTNTARPFVMRGYYTRPDKKSFILEMLLFGDVTTAEALIDHVVENMCTMGLGDNDGICNYIKLGSETVEPERPNLDSGLCIINYQTPTRIKHNRIYLKDEIPFYYLFARFADRLSEIVNVYTSNDFNIDVRELKNSAKNIGMVVNESDYCELGRRSTRTGDWCSLSGFVGSITYTGNLKPFEKVLSYLPWINVGNSTAFGCGWCTLEYSK